MTCALRQCRMKPRFTLAASTTLSCMAALREAEVEARTAAVEPSRHRGELDQRLGAVALGLSFPLAYTRRLKSQRQRTPKDKAQGKSSGRQRLSALQTGHAPCAHHQPLPNPTLNRSANGWPPCPRGARCLCCTSRARRPSVVARLALR